MLTVHLKLGGYLTIGDNITVQVHQRGGSTCVSVDAPREMKILRSGCAVLKEKLALRGTKLSICSYSM